MRRSVFIIPTVAVAGLVLLAGCSNGGGDSCLNGSWQPDMSQFESIEDMGGSVDATMKFSGDTVTTEATVTIPKTDYSEEQVIESVSKGKYSVSDGKIKVSSMTSSTKINGEEQSSDVADMDSLDEGDATYTCSGDKLTIEGQEFTKK